jgi:putative transposase
MFRYTRDFLRVALAGFINRQQQDLIAYLQEENRILREKLGGKRILLNVAQKRRLATAAAKLGCKVLHEITTLFTPETLIRRHRLLRQTGLQSGPEDENGESGLGTYGHIHGELKKLGFKVSWQTVRRIMIEHGLIDDPKHTKRMNSTTFIKSHFESLAAWNGTSLSCKILQDNSL